MAKINRFTQLQPARYNTRTLQELMLAPSYMRQQHDSVQSALGSVLSNLQNVNNLAIHDRQVREEQARLQAQIQEQADRLTREGFTPTSKGDFIKLHSDYTKARSAQGVFGQAEAAKAAYIKNYEDAIKSGTKAGFSPEEMEAAWATHSNLYNQSQQNGKISNIGNLSAPKYVDFIEEVKDLMKSTGETAKTIYNDLGSSEIVTKDPRGQYVLTTKGHKKYKDNVEQIQAVLDYMSNQIMNPNSEVGKSNAFRNITPQQALQQISGLGEIYRERTEDTAYGKSISNFKPAEEAVTVGGGNQLFHLDSQALPSTFSYQDYTKNQYELEEFEKLKNSPTTQLSPEEYSKYKTLKKFQDKVNQELENNDLYQELSQEREDLINSIGLSFNPQEVYWKTGGDATTISGVAPGPSVTLSRDNYLAKKDGTRLTEEEINQYDKYQQTARGLDNRLSQIRNQTTESTTTQTSTYSLMPSTPSGVRNLNYLNEAVAKNLKYGNALNNNYVVEGYEDSSGNYVQNVSEDEKKTISEALKSNRDNTIKVVGYTDEGINSGNPELLVSFLVTDEEGASKERTVRLSYDKTMSDTGISNINDLALNTLAYMGGTPGQDIASKSLKSIYSNYTWKGLLGSAESLNQDASPILRGRMSQILLDPKYKERTKHIRKETDPVEMARLFMEEFANDQITF